MIIVLSNQTYIRPHKHINKTESFHIIEGLIDVVIFDETGNIVEVVHMGDLLSGHNFFYRLSDDYYHTPIIRSDFAVFHETINGPFDRTDTIEAPWAPDEADFFGQKKYSERMLRDLDRLR